MYIVCSVVSTCSLFSFFSFYLIVLLFYLLAAELSFTSKSFLQGWLTLSVRSTHLLNLSSALERLQLLSLLLFLSEMVIQFLLWSWFCSRAPDKSYSLLLFGGVNYRVGDMSSSKKSVPRVASFPGPAAGIEILLPSSHHSTLPDFASSRLHLVWVSRLHEVMLGSKRDKMTWRCLFCPAYGVLIDSWQADVANGDCSFLSFLSTQVSHLKLWLKALVTDLNKCFWVLYTYYIHLKSIIVLQRYVSNIVVKTYNTFSTRT